MNERIQALTKEYTDAVYKESCIREASFLNISSDICGIELNQFTSYHYLLLDFTGNSFLNNKSPELIDIVNFLWVVSKDFVEKDNEKKDEFIKTKCSTLDYEMVVKEIYQYIEDQTIDMLDAFVDDSRPKQNDNKTPKHCWVTQYIDTIASEYHWSEHYIIHLPFARLLQYVKLIDSRKHSEAGNRGDVYANYSEKVLWKLREAAKEEADKESGRI